MMDLLKKFFARTTDEESAGKPVGTSYDVKIATYALLLEMAHIDGEFSELEKESILEVLKKSMNYQLNMLLPSWKLPRMSLKRV